MFSPLRHTAFTLGNSSTSGRGTQRSQKNLGKSRTEKRGYNGMCVCVCVCVVMVVVVVGVWRKMRSDRHVVAGPQSPLKKKRVGDQKEEGGGNTEW